MGSLFTAKIKWLCKIITSIILITSSLVAAEQQEREISLYDTPKYKHGFTHFNYVNPLAPKGGSMTIAAIGTFDSLNPYAQKGTSPPSLDLIYDTLMVQSNDEPFSMYPLVAEAVERTADNKSITFHINKNARFHDGHKITAEDVNYTYNLLITSSSPFYRSYYKDIKRVEVLTPHAVRFIFHRPENKEIPFIVASLPVLPKHFWEKKENDFDAANMNIPLGSGPYRVAAVDPGKQIIYERVKNYWAKDLPVNIGRHNIARRNYDFYRDSSVAIEAIKSGKYDFRMEAIAKNWEMAYDNEAVSSGKLKKETIKTLSPQGMQGFVFNSRRPIFSDKKVRKAIIYALDFEYLNQNLFYNSYSRSNSYFSNSDMAATGLPTEKELLLLKPFQDQLPKDLFTKAYQLPVNDGSGNIRKHYSEALQLLEQAGWLLQNGQLKNSFGEPLQFELLLADSGLERVALAFKKNLSQMGISLNIRTVDTSQYINRQRAFDFEMIASRIAQSINPGNEQLEFWGSKSADITGSRNLMGVKSMVVDSLIDNVIRSPSREKLTTAVKALDRVLLWGEYIIPHWYLPEIRLVYWDKLHHPESKPLYEFSLDTWWVKPDSKILFAKNSPDNDTTIFSLAKNASLPILGLLILIFILRARARKK